MPSKLWGVKKKKYTCTSLLVLKNCVSKKSDFQKLFDGLIRMKLGTDSHGGQRMNPGDSLICKKV